MVLTGWAEQRGYQIVGTYEEQESAWKAGHQRELARLVEDARRRRFGAVLVWSLDRLSREGALAILSLVGKLGVCGVRNTRIKERYYPGHKTSDCLVRMLYTCLIEKDSPLNDRFTGASSIPVCR